MSLFLNERVIFAVLATKFEEELSMKKTTITIPENFNELSAGGRERAINRRVEKAKATKRMGRMLPMVAMCVLGVVAGMIVRPLSAPKAPEPEVVTVTITVPIHDREPWDITEEEQVLVARVVSAMAKGETPLTMEAVAQCVRNACEEKDMTVVEAVEWGKYPIDQNDIGQAAKDAVARVAAGYNAVDSNILYSYNPEVQDGGFHETQLFVCQIGSLRFFSE